MKFDLNRVHHITPDVAELEAARDFYQGVVGLRAAGIATEDVRRDALGPGVVCLRDPDNIAWECFEDDD